MYYDERRNKKMYGKFKHPFAITCRKCGSNDVTVIAYDFRSLGISCNHCKYELDCGCYHTQQYDYSDM